MPLISDACRSLPAEPGGRRTLGAVMVDGYLPERIVASRAVGAERQVGVRPPAQASMIGGRRRCCRCRASEPNVVSGRPLKIDYIIRGGHERVPGRPLASTRPSWRSQRIERDQPIADEADRLLNAAWSDQDWGLLLWLTMLTAPGAAKRRRCAGGTSTSNAASCPSPAATSSRRPA
jgi:hypothetical protein